MACYHCGHAIDSTTAERSVQCPHCGNELLIRGREIRSLLYDGTMHSYIAGVATGAVSFIIGMLIGLKLLRKNSS